MSSYATIDDFKTYGLPAEVVDAYETAYPGDVQLKLDGASGIADGFLRAHYSLPLAAPYSTDLVDAVCRIAAYNLLSVRGFNPQGDAQQVRDRYLDAIEWLKGVSRGSIAPSITDSAGQGADSGKPFVVSPQRCGGVGPPRMRGW